MIPDTPKKQSAAKDVTASSEYYLVVEEVDYEKIPNVEVAYKMGRRDGVEVGEKNGHARAVQEYLDDEKAKRERFRRFCTKCGEPCWFIDDRYVRYDQKTGESQKVGSVLITCSTWAEGYGGHTHTLQGWNDFMKEVNGRQVVFSQRPLSFDKRHPRLVVFMLILATILGGWAIVSMVTSPPHEFELYIPIFIQEAIEAWQ